MGQIVVLPMSLTKKDKVAKMNNFATISDFFLSLNILIRFSSSYSFIQNDYNEKWRNLMKLRQFSYM